jgi:hypothetical protein
MANRHPGQQLPQAHSKINLPPERTIRGEIILGILPSEVVLGLWLSRGLAGRSGGRRARLSAADCPSFADRR